MSLDALSTGRVNETMVVRFTSLATIADPDHTLTEHWRRPTFMADKSRRKNPLGTNGLLNFLN